jgi:serine/threonine protein kinase
MTNLVGQRLGRYEITTFVGSREMADIYRARQEPIGRDVAVKVFHPNVPSEHQIQNALSGFRREAQIAASLSHPHIIKIFDFGEEGDLVYLVTEWLQGENLKQRSDEGVLSLELICQIVEQIASALDYAHEMGVIHGDVKPSNIVLDRKNYAHLIDFGVAQMLNELDPSTKREAIIGTPAYIAAELWQGMVPTASSDLYAFGVSIFEVLTRHLPFTADQPDQWSRLHIHERPPKVTSLKPELPPGLDQVLQKALAKRPEERFRTAEEFAVALKQALLRKQIASERGIVEDSTQALSKPDQQGYPRQFGLYQVSGFIAHGGMSDVYRGVHPTLKREVAIKVLPKHLSLVSDLRIRFEREAQIIAKLHHPNIIRIYDYGEAEGTYYIIMEFITGQSLEAYLQQRGVLPLDEVRRLAHQIAAALDYAHSQQLVHRDIKPSNVLLEPGWDTSGTEASPRAILSDFGIARIIGGNTGLTKSTVVGTFNYIAPEQITQAKMVDHRADIYALGVMLYQMLTGELPFESENVASAIHHHLNSPAPDPRRIVPQLPDRVARAVLRALEKRPENRFALAGLLAAELRA